MNVGLIANRHDMPVNEYIFTEVNPADLDGIEAVAETWCRSHKGGIVSLYVTGLTAALTAVIKWAVVYRIDLDLMHYNRDTGEYIRQELLVWKRCCFCGNPMHTDDTYCGKCGAS